MNLLSKRSELRLLVLVAAIFTIAAVVEGSAQYTVDMAMNDTMGTYLVNETGFTLYYFANDAPGNGTSACSGSCVNNWPPFYAEDVAVPTGLNATDFTTVIRKDGMSQTAFKDWPLYYYAKDMKPGDANGNGVKGIWYVVNPMVFPPKIAG